jgi:hypothetical protein
MVKKEHRNKYKVGVADYLFVILQKFNNIERKIVKITNEN